MAETTETTAPAGDATEQQQSEGFKAPASQEELDRIINAAVARTHKKYEGFEELRAKAEQFDTLKSENETLTGKLADFEAEKERAALVADVAKETGVPASALRGKTREDLEAHAVELARLLKPSGPYVPGQETTPDKVDADPMRELARGLFRPSDS